MEFPRHVEGLRNLETDCSILVAQIPPEVCSCAMAREKGLCNWRDRVTRRESCSETIFENFHLQ